jgi:hypothetical protein
MLAANSDSRGRRTVEVDGRLKEDGRERVVEGLREVRDVHAANSAFSLLLLAERY